jgi:hypothetical protein
VRPLARITDAPGVRRLGTAAPALVCLAWAVTRLPMFLLVLRVIPNSLNFESGDVTTYQQWAGQLAAGHFPATDVRWQYPPGSAAILLLPKLLGGPYHQAFAVVALAADALILALLLRATREGERFGPWLWVVAVPLLGLIVYYRYDMLVSVFAVAAVLVMARRPITGGILTGLGAIVKVWPGLILFGAPPRHRGGIRALTAAITTALAVYAAFTLTMTGADSFLRYQSKRGIEIESIFATPFMIIRHLGVTYRTPLRYGSYEYVGPGVTLVGYLALATTLLALGWMILWRYKANHWTPATIGDAALTATLLFIVISRVISPQYMIWVLALAAAALCIPGTSQKPTALLILITTAITQIEYPGVFDHGIVPGHVLPSLVLVVRNVLLLTTTVVSMRRLWRATVTPPATTTPDARRRQDPAASRPAASDSLGASPQGT